MGIVSLADLYFAERGGDGHKLTVRDAMGPPVTVSPDAPLEKVAERMAREKASAIPVVDAGKLAWIFTTIDALHVLAWLATPPETRRVYGSVQVATVEPAGR